MHVSFRVLYNNTRKFSLEHYAFFLLIFSNNSSQYILKMRQNFVFLRQNHFGFSLLSLAFLDNLPLLMLNKPGTNIQIIQKSCIASSDYFTLLSYHERGNPALSERIFLQDFAGISNVEFHVEREHQRAKKQRGFRTVPESSAAGVCYSSTLNEFLFSIFAWKSLKSLM